MLVHYKEGNTTCDAKHVCVIGNFVWVKLPLDIILGPACKEFGYSEHPALEEHFFLSERSIDINV